MTGAGSLTVRSQRGRALDRIYTKWLERFLVVAAIVHAGVIYYAVAPTMDRGFESAGDELAVIDIPPETKIPPPPEELARPATPVIATAPVEEEVTIAVTDIVENAPVAPVPEPSVPALETEVAASFTFTPYTRKPKCVEGCTPKDLLRYYPPLARQSGVACDVRIGLRIDTSGAVTATDILTSSGSTLCDESVRRWAEHTAWTVAYNRDQPVVVWIAQPIEIAVK